METYTPSPATVLQRLFDEVWNAGDLDAANTLFAHAAPAQAFITQFRSCFPDIVYTVQETITEGERAAMRWHAQGTHQNTWSGIAPTQRVVSFTGMTMAVVRDGKIQHHNTEWNKAGLLKQLQ